MFLLLRVSEDEGRAWNGSVDALLRMDKEDHGMGSRCGHSGIPVHFGGASSRTHSESLAGVDSSPGFRALPRVGLPLPCQTFPACRNGGRKTLTADHTAEHVPSPRSLFGVLINPRSRQFKCHSPTEPNKVENNCFLMHSAKSRLFFNFFCSGFDLFQLSNSLCAVSQCLAGETFP